MVRTQRSSSKLDRRPPKAARKPIQKRQTSILAQDKTRKRIIPKLFGKEVPAHIQDSIKVTSVTGRPQRTIKTPNILLKGPNTVSVVNNTAKDQRENITKQEFNQKDQAKGAQGNNQQTRRQKTLNNNDKQDSSEQWSPKRSYYNSLKAKQIKSQEKVDDPLQDQGQGLRQKLSRADIAEIQLPRVRKNATVYPKRVDQTSKSKSKREISQAGQVIESKRNSKVLLLDVNRKGKDQGRGPNMKKVEVKTPSLVQQEPRNPYKNQNYPIQDERLIKVPKSSQRPKRMAQKTLKKSYHLQLPESSSSSSIDESRQIPSLNSQDLLKRIQCPIQGQSTQRPQRQAAFRSAEMLRTIYTSKHNLEKSQFKSQAQFGTVLNPRLIKPSGVLAPTDEPANQINEESLQRKRRGRPPLIKIGASLTKRSNLQPITPTPEIEQTQQLNGSTLVPMKLNQRIVYPSERKRSPLSFYPQQAVEEPIRPQLPNVVSSLQGNSNILELLKDGIVQLVTNNTIYKLRVNEILPNQASLAQQRRPLATKRDRATQTRLKGLGFSKDSQKKKQKSNVDLIRRQSKRTQVVKKRMRRNMKRNQQDVQQEHNSNESCSKQLDQFSIYSSRHSMSIEQNIRGQGVFAIYNDTVAPESDPQILERMQRRKRGRKRANVLTEQGPTETKDEKVENSSTRKRRGRKPKVANGIETNTANVGKLNEPIDLQEPAQTNLNNSPEVRQLTTIYTRQSPKTLVSQIPTMNTSLLVGKSDAHIVGPSVGDNTRVKRNYVSSRTFKRQLAQELSRGDNNERDTKNNRVKERLSNNNINSNYSNNSNINTNLTNTININNSNNNIPKDNIYVNLTNINVGKTQISNNVTQAKKQAIQLWNQSVKNKQIARNTSMDINESQNNIINNDQILRNQSPLMNNPLLMNSPLLMNNPPLRSETIEQINQKMMHAARIVGCDLGDANQIHRESGSKEGIQKSKSEEQDDNLWSQE